MHSGKHLLGAKFLRRLDDPRSGQISLDLECKNSDAEPVYHSGLALALSWLSRSAWPDKRLWIRGDAQSGKTGLLRHWAQEAEAPMVAFSDLPALVSDFKSLLDHRYLVIDDIGDGTPEAQKALFFLLNAAQARDCRLVLLSRLEPGAVKWAFEDVASRVRSTCQVDLGAENAQERLPLLLSALDERQLRLSPAILHWLATRLRYEPGIVFRAVNWLATASSTGNLPRSLKDLQAAIKEAHPEWFEGELARE